MRLYFGNLTVALSRFLNALIGGNPNTTLSRRVGTSIIHEGWASRFPWPTWLRRHFLDCA